MEKENLTLTKTEETLVTSLQSRERELFREVLQPLQDAFRTVLSDVEKRLGLTPGAIGTEYSLDQQTWTLTPVPPKPELQEEVA